MSARSIPGGTHHLIYHDVRPHDDAFTRRINSTIAPDAFARQLQQLQSVGEICGSDAADASGDRPRFVLWFDDAYRGVMEHAAPICAEHNVVASVAVNSDFVQRKSCFWRCELCWLLENHEAGEVARETLQAEGLNATQIWRRTLLEFDDDLRQRIAKMYAAKAGTDQREALHDLFMDESQLRDLAGRGWMLGNHSATHPAITNSTSWESVRDDFNRCGEYLKRIGGRDDVWVIPFDYSVVKDAVDSYREPLRSACSKFMRAFPFTDQRDKEFSRITIADGSDVLAQIQAALTPAQDPGLLGRIGGFIRRRIKK